MKVTVKMTIEVELSSTFNSLDKEEKEWLEKDILIENKELLLHSNEIGDYVGTVSKVSGLIWIED